MALYQARAERRCHPVLAGGPHLIAHRGGAGLAPENTLAAFRQAVEEWDADLIELDVHASADRHCVVIHDPTVDRTTNGTGAVAALALEEIRSFDAGYRFTPDGCTFPFRGRGLAVPTIEEVLEALPATRFIVEVKAAAAQRPLFEAIRRAGAQDRVVVAAEAESARTLFGAYPGPRSASAAQVRRFYVLHRLRLARFWRLAVDAVQVPESWQGTRVVSPRFVRDLHAQGIPVHVWTVNEAEDMHRLLDWGVDGIVTDRPDRLATVLCERVGRRRPPGLGRQ